jgi:ferredoxin
VRIVVDLERCEGNGACATAAPQVFAVPDLVKVLIERPGEELRPSVERAVRLCPRQAIRVAED